MSGHLFYRRDAGADAADGPALPEGYEIRIWQPRRDGLPKSPLPMRPFAFWWLFDRLRIFASREAGVLMILKGGRLVHRSLVTPRWYRFPDMARGDLQIGDTWTDPDHRGRGLAGAAIAAIHRAWAGRFARMWYLVEADNLPSIKVIERFGYRLVGNGRRTRPLGLSPLGRFVLDQP